MSNTDLSPKIIIFDTTLRDGEMTSGVSFDVEQKIAIAKLLEAMGVDVIEVGYPGIHQKDFDEIFMVSKQIKSATICGLASTKPDEVVSAALALKPAVRGRIHLYTSVNLKERTLSREERTLEAIRDGVALARQYCDDVEWSAFDAPRSDFDFLCQSIEVAIASGATTISIPDSLGLSSTAEFSTLIERIVQRIPNCDRITLSVHCHDDLGLAVNNSIAALQYGVRQIECSINGLGARQGNADLGTIVREVLQHPDYQIDIDTTLISRASELVTQLTRIPLP
jgi:2-isopropylmalate synthase